MPTTDINYYQLLYKVIVDVDFTKWISNCDK